MIDIIYFLVLITLMNLRHNGPVQMRNASHMMSLYVLNMSAIECRLFRIVNHFRSFWNDIVVSWSISLWICVAHSSSMLRIRIQMCSDLNSCVLTIEIHAQLHIPCVILFRKKIAIKERIRIVTMGIKDETKALTTWREWKRREWEMEKSRRFKDAYSTYVQFIFTCFSVFIEDVHFSNCLCANGVRQAVFFMRQLKKW